MFKRLKFQHKMLIGPALAGLAFCLVLAISTVVLAYQAWNRSEPAETKSNDSAADRLAAPSDTTVPSGDVVHE